MKCWGKTCPIHSNDALTIWAVAQSLFCRDEISSHHVECIAVINEAYPELNEACYLVRGQGLARTAFLIISILSGVQWDGECQMFSAL